MFIVAPSSVPSAPAIAAGFIGAIGRTPLIRLRCLSEATGCEILGKAEFQNPGGSIKDRAALSLIEDAERSGALQPGGTLVEGTAGNTGIGLALVGHAKGYSHRGGRSDGGGDVVVVQTRAHRDQ